MPTSSQLKLNSFATRKLSGSTGRHGFTVTELIVAAGLLVVVMSIVTSLTVRSSRLRQDARHYRLAIDELTNHLERLTALDETDLDVAITALAVSPQIQATLPNPVLSAKRQSDVGGARLVLQLAWDRLGKFAPVTLVGWVNPLPTKTTVAVIEEAL